MAIRKNLNPRQMDLQPEMRDILMRNGMQAHIIANGDGYQLAVQGHDSPLLTYNLTEKQMLALTDWGTNSANKKAYNVFTSIIGKDFYMPRNLVHARNANGRVAMGLHGYRIGTGEYGRLGWSPEFLGWTPRMHDGYHLRRVGGQMFYAGAPMVAERPDRRLKPGELTSGGYGFYYKGQQQVASQADVLQNLQAVMTPVETRPRSQEPAKPYKELISSPVYFSNDQWQECLSSHGIIIDEKAKTLTIQSESTKSDMVYDLTDDELKALTNNSVKQVSVAKRLDILNNVIKDDFADKITMDMLNSKERISIGLKPEVESSLARQRNDDTLQVVQDPLASVQHVAPTLDPDKGYVNGADLEKMNERKAWYREGKHGREVDVGDIWVEKNPFPQPQSKEGNKDESKENKFTYKMCAVINGEVVSHAIDKKQYDKFMAVDDYQRQRMMSKIFHEVDMKSRPELRKGFNLGAFLGAGLTALSEATYLGADIAHNVEHIKHPHPSPEVHSEVHGTGRIYVKPGVDSPQSIAERAFDAGLNAGLHHGGGMGR